MTRPKHSLSYDLTITFSPLQVATLCTALHFASMCAAHPNTQSPDEWQANLLDLRYQIAALAFRESPPDLL